MKKNLNPRSKAQSYCSNKRKCKNIIKIKIKVKNKSNKKNNKKNEFITVNKNTKNMKV